MLLHSIANVKKQARVHPKPASKIPLWIARCWGKVVAPQWAARPFPFSPLKLTAKNRTSVLGLLVLVHHHNHSNIFLLGQIKILIRRGIIVIVGVTQTHLCSDFVKHLVCEEEKSGRRVIGGLRLPVGGGQRPPEVVLDMGEAGYPSRAPRRRAMAGPMSPNSARPRRCCDRLCSYGGH